MAEVETMKAEELGEVEGGRNTTNWQGAHWQPVGYAQGTTFQAYGYTWYVIAYGDSLSGIAYKFGYGANYAALQAKNPATITNCDRIYAGDAIIVS